MKRKLWKVMLLIVVLSMFAVLTVQAEAKDGLAELRDATAQYHRPQVAQTAGYDLVSGLDHCFNNPGVGAMGYHYINLSLLDTTVDFLQPEAMVYTPGPNGVLQLGAIEYIVPAAAWDAEHSELPQVIGQEFHLNSSLGVYVLHIWVWKNNPSGMFEDWNPKVSCP
ncbi:MAG: hypothetical protein C3F07_10795 [Anaerolineales bacterium]|nr:hypothetical protein [Anaerolineae bacterium]PWB72900.1 MAG: hypothetical protein C3F07_10795 [Anaerolineales bacterium]